MSALFRELSLNRRIGLIRIRYIMLPYFGRCCSRLARQPGLPP